MQLTTTDTDTDTDLNNLDRIGINDQGTRNLTMLNSQTINYMNRCIPVRNKFVRQRTSRTICREMVNDTYQLIS